MLLLVIRFAARYRDMCSLSASTAIVLRPNSTPTYLCDDRSAVAKARVRSKQDRYGPSSEHNPEEKKHELDDHVALNVAYWIPGTSPPKSMFTNTSAKSVDFADVPACAPLEANDKNIAYSYKYSGYIE